MLFKLRSSTMSTSGSCRGFNFIRIVNYFLLIFIHCSFKSDSNRNLYMLVFECPVCTYVCVSVSVCVGECVLVARCLCLKNDVRQVVRPCLGAHLVLMYNFSLLIIDLLRLLVAEQQHYGTE